MLEKSNQRRKYFGEPSGWIMKNQNLKKELIDLKVEDPQNNLLESYSSHRQFKQLTKNIPRLDKRAGKSFSFYLDNSQKLSTKQIQTQRNNLTKNVLKKPQNFNRTLESHNSLKKSASGKYFSLQNLEKISEQNKKHQLVQKDQVNEDRESDKKFIHGEENKKDKTQPKAFKRFKPLVSVFLLQVAINIMFGIPALYMFFTLDSMFKKYLATIQYCLITVFYVSSSFYIIWGHGRKGLIEFLMMHILIDTLLLIMVVVSIGFIGMLTVFFSDQWFSCINVVGIPVMNFFFVGNFRLFLKWIILSAWQIIVWKLTFFVDGMIYFGIGAYYMAVNYKLTQGYLPDVESKLKDFCLLFVFANFSLYVEMFGAIGAKDKTEDLQYQYVMCEQSDDENDYLKQQPECNYSYHFNKSKPSPNDNNKRQQNINDQNQKNQKNIKENQKTQQQDLYNCKQQFKIPQQSPIYREEKLINFQCNNLNKNSDYPKEENADRMFFTINKINWSNTKFQTHQFGLSSL